MRHFGVGARPFRDTTTAVQGGYVRIYLNIIILKNYVHRARGPLARALAPRAKVGRMSQL